MTLVESVEAFLSLVVGPFAIISPVNLDYVMAALSTARCSRRRLMHRGRSSNIASGLRGQLFDVGIFENPGSTQRRAGVLQFGRHSAPIAGGLNGLKDVICCNKTVVELCAKLII